jgi:hypothetical protein
VTSIVDDSRRGAKGEARSTGLLTWPPRAAALMSAIVVTAVLFGGCHRATSRGSNGTDASSLHSAEVCDDATRLVVQRSLHRVSDTEALRTALRHPCLEAIGGRLLLQASDDALWAWFGGASRMGAAGADWLEHVARDPAAPLEKVTLPPTLRAGAEGILTHDPTAAALAPAADGTCDPVSHWVAEAERLHELEAYNEQTWTPREPAARGKMTELGFLRGQPELGVPCLQRLSDAGARPSAAAWQACMQRSRSRRAMMPVGRFCSPTAGRVVLTSWRTRECDGARSFDRFDVSMNLADGRVEWHERCPPPRAPKTHVPTSAVRRATFYALLRPHVVVGAPSKEDVEVPSGLTGGPLAPVPLRESVLPSYAKSKGQASHTTALTYRVVVENGEREGTCMITGYGDYGEAPTCTALADLMLMVIEGEGGEHQS